jgi:hypothetical protein
MAPSTGTAWRFAATDFREALEASTALRFVLAHQGQVA